MANLYYQTPEGEDLLKRNPPVQTKVDPYWFRYGGEIKHLRELPPDKSYLTTDDMKARLQGIAHDERALRASETRPSIDPNMRVPIPEDGSVEGGILARFPNDGGFIFWLQKDEFKSHPRVQKALSDIMNIQNLINKNHMIAYSKPIEAGSIRLGESFVDTIKDQERKDAFENLNQLGKYYKYLIHSYKSQFNWDTYT